MDQADIFERFYRSQANDRHIVEGSGIGLALVILGQQPVDLVISDLMMPEFDGIELLEHMRSDSNLQDLPFILFTARTSDGTRLQALRQAGSNNKRW